MASEYDKTVDPWRVPQLSASEQHLVWAQRDLLRRSLRSYKIECALVGVQRVIGVLGSQ